MNTANAQSERQVSFNSSVDDVIIHGTLTTPADVRGAVLMIVGSGKADRDETVPASMTYSGKAEKLFLQLSQSLIKSGYATLRYDKRGVLDENGNVDLEIWKSADREHLIADAIDAAKFLAKETKTPLEKLIILGHSEGTIISVETAIGLGGKVQALLLFGAQGRHMREMLHFQIVEVNLTDRSSNEEKDALEQEFVGALEYIRSSREEFAPDEKPIKWYRQFLAAPANFERALLVDAKFAFFQGEDDVQTPRGEVDLFLKAGVKNAKVFSYPELGHGFSPRRNGSPTLGPVDLSVGADLINFLSSL